MKVNLNHLKRIQMRSFKTFYSSKVVAIHMVVTLTVEREKRRLTTKMTARDPTIHRKGRLRKLLRPHWTS